MLSNPMERGTSRQAGELAPDSSRACRGRRSAGRTARQALRGRRAIEVTRRRQYCRSEAVWTRLEPDIRSCRSAPALPPPDGDERRVDQKVGSMRRRPDQCGKGILRRSRKAVFGCEPIVHGDDRAAGYPPDARKVAKPILLFQCIFESRAEAFRIVAAGCRVAKWIHCPGLF